MWRLQATRKISQSQQYKGSLQCNYAWAGGAQGSGDYKKQGNWLGLVFVSPGSLCPVCCQPCLLCTLDNALKKPSPYRHPPLCCYMQPATSSSSLALSAWDCEQAPCKSYKEQSSSCSGLQFVMEWLCAMLKAKGGHRY